MTSFKEEKRSRRQRVAQKTLTLTRRREARRHRYRQRERCGGYAQLAGPYYRALLGRLHLAPSVAERVLGIAEMLFMLVPHRPEHEIGWMVSLAGQRWIRPLTAWRKPGCTLQAQREDLTRHLLMRFPVPQFLMRYCDPTNPVLRRATWAVGVIAVVGRGRSLRKSAGTPAFPTLLTRRMCHNFLASDRHCTPTLALTQAQVLGHGGSPELVAALMRTQFTHLQFQEPDMATTWNKLLGWLSRNWTADGADRQQLNALFRWVAEKHTDGRPIILQGRSMARVFLEMAELHASRGYQVRFPGTDFRGFEAEFWSIHEIRTPAELDEEGGVMNHCVGRYRAQIDARQCSIWSIRNHDVRVATVELTRKGQVVQVRGYSNRKVTAPQLRFLRQWVEINGLSISGNGL